MMTYAELWQPLEKQYGKGEAKAIVRLMLEQRFHLSLTDIVGGKLEQLPAEEVRQLEAIEQRLLAGEPVQYVLGEASFCGRTFHVEPGVLIPRPETEELCRWIVEEAEPSVAILDVGTGSGCIACTLAAELPDASVTAWDISEEALRIAQDNARRCQVDVTFLHQDIMLPYPQAGSSLEGTSAQVWDIIVSNPPYVCEKERATMEQHVLDYEPELALFVPDDDPLLFYRSILRLAASTLRSSGRVYFEINPLYVSELTELLQDSGFHHVTVKEDFLERKRFIRACK